jgi:Rieske Fe-S protein
MNHNAVFALYPQVATARGDEAFDAQGSKVEIDMAAVNAWVDPNAYKRQRAAEYPPMADYLDAVVKGDQAQIDAYVAACLAVKAKYPKEQA